MVKKRGLRSYREYISEQRPDRKCGRMTTDELLQNLRDDLNKIINVLKNDWKALLFLAIAIFGTLITMTEQIKNLTDDVKDLKDMMRGEIK